MMIGGHPLYTGGFAEYPADAHAVPPGRQMTFKSACRHHLYDDIARPVPREGEMESSTRSPLAAAVRRFRANAGSFQAEEVLRALEAIPRDT